jgi:hypothetical protein
VNVSAERVGEAGGVGRALVLEDGHAGDVEGVLREAGHDLALKGVEEAHAKDVVADLGHRGVRARRGDHRDAPALADAPAREGEGARHLADDPADVLPVDEPGDGAGGLVGVSAGVFGHGPHLLPEEPPGGVDLFEGDVHPVAGGDAEVGLVAGEREVEPDGDPAALLLARGHRANERGERHGFDDVSSAQSHRVRGFNTGRSPASKRARPMATARPRRPRRRSGPAT